MNKRILAPLDGSKPGEAALPHAIALARAYGYGLTLLHVATPPRSFFASAWGVSPVADVWRDFGEGLEEEKRYLESVAERLRPKDVDVRTALTEDEQASHSIISYAETHPDVALIVMSTHGRSGVGRWVLGSVTEEVLHSSPVPLLVVHYGDEEALPEDFSVPEYESLLVPLDGSVFGSQALDTAETLAAILHSTLTLVSAVVEQPVAGELVAPPVLPVERPDEVAMLANYLEEERKKLEADGLTVQTKLQCGPADQVILRSADATHADLLIMATHGRTGVPRLLLGSIAMQVVQASALPVLMVHTKERVKEPEAEPAHTGLALALAI